MTEKMECEVSLSKLPRKTISSVSYKLNADNLFIQLQYDDTSFVDSPSFEFVNATWNFRFELQDRSFLGNKIFVRMLSSNFETREQVIFFQINFLDAEDKEYNNVSSSFIFSGDKDEGIDWLCAIDEELSYDKCGSLNLIINLFHIESTEVELDQPSLSKNSDVDVLSQDFKKLFLNGKNHDLTLRVADKEFRVHQDILMARSQVFQAMLTHDMTEKNKGVIDVPDCDPQAMEQFLFHVYSGKVETLNQDNALGLYYAADKYNMALLKEECTEYLKQSLNPSIICGVIQLALNHSDSDLLECATGYFLDHTHEIFPTLEWMSFLKTNSVAANELLIKASEKWNSAN